MSNVVPTYPNSIFTWVDRIDQVNIDFANDINSVASDLISTELTLGVNPQIEKHPPNNLPRIQYSNIDSRISDAMSNAQLPVCVLRGGPFVVGNQEAGHLTNFNAIFDPYSMFNGTDITINTNGWYIYTVHQTWNWWNDGFSHTFLQTNGNTVAEDLVDWEFSGNGKDESDESTPRWQRFGLRSRVLQVTWQGRSGPGERVSVLAENGTSNTHMQVTYTAMHVAMVRILPVNLDASIQ